MASPKKRRSDVTGYDDRGRHTFDEAHADCVRAYLLVKIRQVEAIVDRLRAAIKRTPTDKMTGQLAYYGAIASFLRGWYNGGTRTVPAIDWISAWTEVSVMERAKGERRDDQPTLPGM